MRNHENGRYSSLGSLTEREGQKVTCPLALLFPEYVWRRGNIQEREMRTREQVWGEWRCFLNRRNGLNVIRSVIPLTSKEEQRKSPLNADCKTVSEIQHSIRSSARSHTPSSVEYTRNPWLSVPIIPLLIIKEKTESPLENQGWSGCDKSWGKGTGSHGNYQVKLRWGTEPEMGYRCQESSF